MLRGSSTRLLGEKGKAGTSKPPRNRPQKFGGGNATPEKHPNNTVKAEISLSGFWSKSLLENRGLFGGFFGGVSPSHFPRKMARKNPWKNPPRKPNTKIHEKFQGKGVLETQFIRTSFSEQFLLGSWCISQRSRQKFVQIFRMSFCGAHERNKGLRLWSWLPPNSPETQENFKVTPKWLKSDFPGLPSKSPKSDSKLTFCPCKSHFCVTFESLWGNPGKSLFSHFWVTLKFSRVSGELGQKMQKIQLTSCNVIGIWWPRRFSIEGGNIMPQKAHLNGYKGIQCPKSPFKWFNKGTPKRQFWPPNVIFPIFQFWSLCRGLWDCNERLWAHRERERERERERVQLAPWALQWPCSQDYREHLLRLCLMFWRVFEVFSSKPLWSTLWSKLRQPFFRAL